MDNSAWTEEDSACLADDVFCVVWEDIVNLLESRASEAVDQLPFMKAAREEIDSMDDDDERDTAQDDLNQTRAKIIHNVTDILIRHMRLHEV